MKKLVFDVTDANTILDSDSVGAFLRASDGTLLTHTDVAGKKALDVRIAEGINVEVDLDAGDDSVAAYLNDGAGNSISSTGGAIHISDAGGSLTVDAVDLDIRDLAFATDKVDASGSEVSLDASTLAALETINAVQSGTWDIGTLTSITNDVNIADGGNSITVDAVDFDIRDLSAASDSVQSNLFDGAGTALTSTLVSGDQALDVNVVNELTVNDAALADTAILSSADTLAVAGTAETVVTSNLAARKYLFVHNYDNREMYIGASGVDSSNGFPLSPSQTLELRVGPSVDVYYDSAKTGHAIRVLQTS